MSHAAEAGTLTVSLVVLLCGPIASPARALSAVAANRKRKCATRRVRARKFLRQMELELERAAQSRLQCKPIGLAPILRKQSAIEILPIGKAQKANCNRSIIFLASCHLLARRLQLIARTSQWLLFYWCCSGLAAIATVCAWPKRLTNESRRV